MCLCFTKEWKDDHIRWNPASYAGLKYLVVPPDDVWLPDVAIINRLPSCVVDYTPSGLNQCLVIVLFVNLTIDD